MKAESRYRRAGAARAPGAVGLTLTDAAGTAYLPISGAVIGGAAPGPLSIAIRFNPVAAPFVPINSLLSVGWSVTYLAV